MKWETVTITYEDLLRAMCDRSDQHGPCGAHKDSADKIWKKLTEEKEKVGG